MAKTFFGLGYHDHREHWITGVWFWNQISLDPNSKQKPIGKAEAEEIIQKRREEISPNNKESEQTEYGKLFEILADLTEKDGALAEIEDLESM